jgi:hypothetical protein
MGNPYVISAELDLATADLEQIVNQNRIESFREGVDADLRAMGKDIRWVPSSTIRRNLARAIATTNLPVISLDDRYVSSASQYLVSQEVSTLC